MSVRNSSEIQGDNPLVSVLVPAYQATEFIRGTLDSLHKQSYRNIELIVSVDSCNDNTDGVVNKWCQEHPEIKSSTYLQETRLGWVKNVNFLLGQCQSRYFMILPHDDLLNKFYIEKMIKAHQQNSGAVVAYSDIRRIGRFFRGKIQKSILGSRYDRVRTFLKYHFNAVAFRGVVNQDVLADLLYIREGETSGFAKDTLWNLQMAIKGDMIRVPGAYYYKRYRKDSVHAAWGSSRENKISAWLNHCRDCLDVVDRDDFSAEEKASLCEAVTRRLLQQDAKLCFYNVISSLNNKEQEAMLASLRLQ